MKFLRNIPSVEKEHSAENLSIWQVIFSILASFFGVQNSRNRRRDFQFGKAKTFIAVGILMTAIWYLAIYLVVNLVLHVAK